MLRRFFTAGVLLAACSSDDPPPTGELVRGDAGTSSGGAPSDASTSSSSSSSSSGASSSGGAAQPECVKPTENLVAWDDFEEPLGDKTRFDPNTATNITLGAVHYCGKQGLTVVEAAGSLDTSFLHTLEPPAGPLASFDWTILVNFELASSATTFRFATLSLENGHRFGYEFHEGKLSFVMGKGDAQEQIADDVASLTVGAWQRVDLHLEYGSPPKATLKVGPPDGSGTATVPFPTIEVSGRPRLEQLGATAPASGSVTVHFDRASVQAK